MAAKHLTLNQEARDALTQGVSKLARAVKVTLGPRGRNAVLDKGWGNPTITKDGVTVAEEIELSDKKENLAAQIVKQVASKTSDVAGDGTTTATVLTEAIFLEAMKHIAAGADPMSLQRGMLKATDAVVAELKKMSTPVENSAAIANVATIAANNDSEIGKHIAMAMEKVGQDGVITVEEAKGIETVVDVVEGMQFDRGYLSPHFVTDAEAMECVLENCYILIHEEKLSAVKPLVPLLEKISKAGKPLLIIAEDVEGDALATLVVNKLKGILQVAAVKAPGYGERRKAMMEDIAILTGGKAIFKDLGIELEKVSLNDLGKAKKVRITADDTTILQGAGSEAAIKGRIEQIKREIEETTSDYDREKLQERLAKLAGGVAQINVGAATETEMKEKKARVEDALHATRAAREEGIVPGGGVALLRARAALDGLKLEGDEAMGVEIIRKALELPAKIIAENAGMSGSVVVDKILKETKNKNWGYDADRNEFCDMVKAGIIDPTKVTRFALQNAVSAAGCLFTTGCLITEVPKKKSKGPGGHGGPGMGGMDDMDM